MKPGWFTWVGFDWFTWMAKNNVKLQPVLEKNGKRTRCIRWSAGYTILASDGWTNIVLDGAEGDTPIEALAALKTKKLKTKKLKTKKRRT